MTGPSFEELIERKRDGHEHSPDEMERIVAGYTSGEMPDYQMSAWLMAALLRGLSAEETVAMTEAMVRSGDVVDLSTIPGVKVDKHSTGGVADTTTLVLAPLVSACGVPVAKMSGRGLGHTGGTLDKLEAIPGFRVELSPEEFVAQVERIGIAVVAQSPRIDPADKKIYALRDVTGTVPSIPLIVGSIISKKIAGGADAIVLDVKVGSGAFMKTEADARQLAHELTAVGEALGRRVVCLMSDMGQPLGMAVGNALEVAEAVDTLRGEGPAALTELCMAFGARMLILGERAADETEARALLSAAIVSGRALERFREWVAAQEGDPRVADDLTLLPRSAVAREVRATTAGYVARFDAEGVGRSAMVLGAGREHVGDAIDPGAGLVLSVRIGDRVTEGDLLCTMYAASEPLLDAGEERFRRSVHFAADRVEAPPLFHEL
ncbi:MAG: thymidine phosphorylase [Acidimicrobiales bacterium]|nr:thymidine phosphorylase [Acidimicrobiales bacterium]